MRVYLGGPITGLSYEEARNGWRRAFANSLSKKIEPLSPMRQEGHLAEIKEISGHAYDSNPLSTARGIFAKDCLDIDRSDVVVFNYLDAKRPSVGSIFEMGYAYHARKPIVTVMRRGFDNPHDHLFVLESSSYIVPTVSEAAAIVNAILLPGL